MYAVNIPNFPNIPNKNSKINIFGVVKCVHISKNNGSISSLSCDIFGFFKVTISFYY